MDTTKTKGKAVVVGGSIAGISCAHALIAAGWDVVVLEKARSPATGCTTGAGIALDSFSLKLIKSWIKQPHLLEGITLPLAIEHDIAVEGNKKITWTLARDENYDLIAAHWGEIHSLLYKALPINTVLWGHLFLSCSISDDKTCVSVRAKRLKMGHTIDMVADLLVGADGSRSSVRKCRLPDHKLRNSGYCAVRGVLDYSNDEHSETVLEIKKAFPDLGRCNYFILGSQGHIVLFELPNRRINWVWFVNQTEPDFEGKSLTKRISEKMKEKMYNDAEKVWTPELVQLLRETKDPFLNGIYDTEPLEQYFWDNIVLIGDAAHATTPHGARSTNMSIVDAAVLGKCMEKWGVKNLKSALKEYQSIQLPVTSELVLSSRCLGRIKQGMALSEEEQPFDPTKANEEDCKKLLLRNMPFFCVIPPILL